MSNCRKCGVCGKVYQLKEYLALAKPANGIGLTEYEPFEFGIWRNCPCNGTMMYPVNRGSTFLELSAVAVEMLNDSVDRLAA